MFPAELGGKVSGGGVYISPKGLAWWGYYWEG
jgi:hypothetical protein